MKKAKMDGNERDAFSKHARRFIRMSRGFRKWVKVHFNRRQRHAENAAVKQSATP